MTGQQTNGNRHVSGSYFFHHEAHDSSRPRSAFGFRRYLARACHGPDGVGSCAGLHDISAFRARRRGAYVRCALLYPLSHSLLRARIRLPRWDRRISRYEPWQDSATSLVVLLYARSLACITRIHNHRLCLGLRPLGSCGRDMDLRLEHVCDGLARVASVAVDRCAGAGHDRDSQFARPRQSGVFRKVLLVMDNVAHTRTHFHNSLSSPFCQVRADSVGRSYGRGICFWEPAAPARSPQVDSDSRTFRDCPVLRAAWIEPLRKWYCGAAVWISTFCRPLERTTDTTIDAGVIF